MPFASFSFTKQLAVLLSCVMLLGMLSWWSYSAHQLDDILTHQISLRAQVQSQQLSQLSSLIAAVGSGSASKTSEIINAVQAVSDADFITVSDRAGIRLAHPVAERVGLPVLGGDIERALENGESYLSYGVGSLGPSVRYISPIFSNEGDVIGMIKVGYLIDTLDLWTSERLLPLISFGIIAVAICIWLSWKFSRYVRTQMQELEPWQLKQALKTHQGVLQATYEGLVAINSEGSLYLINDSARAMLNYHQELGNVFTDGIDNPESFSLKGDDYINGLIRVNGKNLVMNRVTLRTSTGEPYGAVFSLRDQNEMHVLSEKISQVTQYMENMRVARHEYQNKLSTISGLLQMGAYDKALSVCLSQAKASQSQLDSLHALNSRPALSALILAKASKANELGVALSIDCQSDLSALSRCLSEEQLCGLIGNLAQNALEAVKGQENGHVHIGISESACEYTIQVSNNGPLIESEFDVLCELGFTTKQNKADHGVGMYLVRSIVEQGNGHMELDSDEQETAFTIYFPKELG
ncbi:ATP-binding protein [Vibrio parahaemolyticus]|uniref:Sensor histidine kinase n=5 Tax=Vibrio TaxID=662 RepID=A0A249W0X8_VIBPH|nr:sensor histidine kinase [Vibrio parahaemolyticus]ASZ49721.1 sensor histidine kinase [Vibrio parahaemolyticus]AUT89071.1 sensor histidine kinase [Vibrio parahaemolyticus]EGF41470.1 putative sensor kinase CitA [Vibrio parahaemolyticus 10329]EGQ7708810.1 sensor histidine kinase [Vibrio parahaemolyticus]EGQ7771162.1 sensor histidine kinase [Vibrio parahaemolyticus]